MSPRDGETGVPIDHPIKITFTQPMDIATFDKETFSVKRESEDVEGVRRLIDNDTVAIFEPEQKFSEGSKYTVTVKGVKDKKGTRLITSYEWYFVTGSFIK